MLYTPDVDGFVVSIVLGRDLLGSVAIRRKGYPISSVVLIHLDVTNYSVIAVLTVQLYTCVLPVEYHTYIRFAGSKAAPSADRRADVEAYPIRLRPKFGPETRCPARKHYCVI